MIYPQKYNIKYPKVAAYDVLTEAHICRVLREEFGKQYIRGSSLFKMHPDGKYQAITCIEAEFRSFLTDVDNVLEIGTGFGVTALLLAHYAYHLTTIDEIPFTEPLTLWAHFGVHHKIYYAVCNPEEKRGFIEQQKFDFAHIDGKKSYDDVRSDFELVQRCGRVLFSGYREDYKDSVIKVVSELPNEEITIKEHFAYWEKK